MASEAKEVTAKAPVAKAEVPALSATNEYPGQTMGIVALVLAFFTQIPALVLGIIAWIWSNKAGENNVPAKVAVAVSSVLIVLGVLAVIGWILVVATTLQDFGGFEGFRGFEDMGCPGLRS